MSIDFSKNNLILIWLTNEDQNNPVSLQTLEIIKEHFASSKMKLVIYSSGKEDLIECTQRLLSKNKNQIFR